MRQKLIHCGENTHDVKSGHQDLAGTSVCLGCYKIVILLLRQVLQSFEHLMMTVWCVHVYLFSLSFLVDLMFASSSAPGHVCLAAPTRGGWLMPSSICLPTCLVV